MANENENKVIANPELVEAINEMRKDFTNETQNKVVNLALRSTFLVPAIVDKNTQLIADSDNNVKFEDKPQAKFMLITHKEKGTFFPAFTDPDELMKFKTDEKFQSFAMKFSDLAALTEKTPEVTGFVLNPMSHNLPFTKPMLETIKETLLRVRKEREAAEKAAAENSEPNITVSSNDDE